MDGIPHALSGPSHMQFPPPPPGVLADRESAANEDFVMTAAPAPPAADMEQRQGQGDDDDDDDDEAVEAVGGASSSSKAATPPPPAFALARVSKIIKADQDVEIVNKEALRAIAVATELFIGHLADQAYTQARLQKRKVVTYKDLNAAVQASSLSFLDDVVPAPTDLSSAFGRRKKHLAEAESLAVGMNGASLAATGNAATAEAPANGDAAEQAGRSTEQRAATTTNAASHAILGKPPGESEDEMSDAD